MTPYEQVECDRDVAALRAQVGEAVLALVWAEGRAFTLDQAVEYALETGET